MAPSWSSLASFLPSLPSLPFPSLPTNLQHRLLAFLLRKAVGSFVKGGLDSQAIEADLGGGTVRIQAIELAEQAITPLLSDVPVSFVSGSIGLVGAQVSFPLSLSSQLSLQVDDLHLVLRVDTPTSNTIEEPSESTDTLDGKRRSTSLPELQHTEEDDGEDAEDLLAGSMLSVAVASEFIRHELDANEDSQLKGSLHQSLFSEDGFDLPGAFAGPSARRSGEPGASDEQQEEVTMLAGLIERILARLQVRVRRIRVRLVWGDPAEEDAEHEIELGVEEIAYEEADQEVGEAFLSRHKLTIIKPEVRMRSRRAPTRAATPRSSQAADDDGSSTESEEEEEEDKLTAEHDMMMSQSIADLRTSFVSATSGGSESVYASARGSTLSSRLESLPKGKTSTSASVIEEEDSPFLDPEAGDEEVPSSDEAGDLNRLLLSFGPEPIAIYLSSTAPATSTPPTDLDDLTPLPPKKPGRPELSVRSSIAGPITLLVFPDQIQTLLDLATSLTSRPSTLPLATRPAPPRKSTLALTVAITLKLIHVVVVYSPPTSPPAQSTFDSFWAHPTTFLLPCDQIRLRLEGLGAWVVRHPSNPSETVFPLRSFSLTEHTTSLCHGEARSLPIVVSDPNLGKQYSTAEAFPEFEMSDWMRNRAGEGRGWKVKSKAKAVFKGSKPEETVVEPAATLKMEEGRTSINLLPIHCFVDLTLVERLHPFVASILESITTPLDAVPSRSAISSTSNRTPRSATPLPPNRLLENLSFDPVHSKASTSTPHLEVHCALLRIAIRCPPPRDGEHGRKRPAHDPVRSGIVVFDVHDLQVALISPGASAGGGETNVTWTRSLLFFVPPWASTDAPTIAKALLSVSHFSISGEGHDPVKPTPPMIVVRQVSLELHRSRESLPSPTGSSGSNTKTTFVDCSVPLLRTSLDKSTLDGLQLFADDVSQWAARLGADPEESGSSFNSVRTERNPKMIGSRYFGAKSFMRGRQRAGSESEEGVDDGTSAVTIKVEVTDVLVDLWIERHVDGKQESQREPRHLRGLAADLKLELDLLRNSQNDLRAQVVVGDLTFEDVSDPANICRILARTLAPNLTSTTSLPVVKVDFTSSVEKETDLKESKVQVVLGNFTYFLTADLDWTTELSRFAKAPAGAFESVVPNELTRVRVKLVDGSVHVTPPTLVDSHLVLSIGEARVATNLIPDMPRTLVSVDLLDLRALAVESAGDLRTDVPASRETGYRYWRSRGFVELLDLHKSSIQIRQGNGLVLPDFELNVADTKLRMSICADSVSCVSNLVTDLLSAPAFKSSPTTSPSPTSSRRLPARKTSADLLASIDPAAFRHAPSIADFPEILTDDVPTNFDYLAEALQQGSGPSTRPLPASTKATRVAEGQGQIISNIAGETIRMLDPKGLHILDDYLAVPREDDSDRIGGAPASVIRCRFTNSEVTISLHEGYDWSSTRKAIEEERKAIRRRLERIRQLLASGQTADASAEQASVLVFGSVQLGLAPGAFELPPKELLAAIDEELDESASDAGEDTTTASVSSWQTMPGGGVGVGARAGTTRRPSAATMVGKARKRLTRSTSSAIEINLRGLSTSFDGFGPNDSWTSRVRIDVDAFELLDNIKTSTWRKFLTELRPIDGGVPRASGASMARVELNKVQPVGRTVGAQEEFILKIKISPLRLYVDQDALDFLKAFGAFKLPDEASSGVAATESTPTPTPASNELFFQRVEVFPVKIKLDYKAKRVDYHALRRGKTAELMNFFNFDGSEITLRHLVVTGISGSTRLSDLVQDIWTQDVKANQLADVISGIAPVRSVVNVGSGVANLVLLPIEQFRKDGRVVRGLHKGASAFARQTTMEALSVGARLATGTQVILEQAENLLGGNSSNSASSSRPIVTPRTSSFDSSGGLGSPSLPNAALGTGLVMAEDGDPIHLLTNEERQELISRYAAQPSDVREGIESAYRSMGDHLRSAAQTILAVPMEVYEQSGNDGPVRAVVRAVPVAVLKPMIGASEAMSKALLGLRNTFDPDSAQIEASDKYKQASH